MLRRAILVFVPITLVACAYYKNYNPANTTSTPRSWNNKDAFYKNSQIVKLPYLAWWHKFNDPVLSQLIESGLTNNNGLNVAMANVEAAEGELKRVKLNWVPSLSSNLGYSSFPDLGYPGALITIIPTYTINIFSQIKEQQKAEYELKATKAMSDGVALAVIGQIANSYFTLIAQTEQYQLFQQLDKDLTEVVTISKAIYSGGLTSELVVDNSKSELDLIKAQEFIIQQNIIASQNALHYLINENPGNIVMVRKFSQLNGEQIIIGNLPLTVIENRPDMIQAANELKASNEGIGLAFSNLLPSIQLSAARGSIGDNNAYGIGNPIYFNRALLEVPLFNASVYGQLDRAHGLNKASYYRYTDTLRKVLREVNTDMSAHDLFTSRFNVTVSSKYETQKAYQLHQSLYQRDIISYLELLESKIKLDHIDIVVNQSKLEQFITIVNLYQDLAGGYKYSPL